MKEIKKIAVLGSGIMGQGIAQLASQVGKFKVSMHDIDQKLIDNGVAMINNNLNISLIKGQVTAQEKEETLSRIHGDLDLQKAVSDAELVIEAVTENADIKKSLLHEVDKHIPNKTIVASNTSSISITNLASVLKNPQRFCGMHFFNPPQTMKLIEIIKGEKTSTETIQTVSEIARMMGKETVLVKKDVPGFIVNRILVPALNEAVQILSEGVADREDIDKAIKLGLNWPMGPLMLIDYIGADTTLSIAEILEQNLGQRFTPSPKLKKMVKSKKLGKKTGQGFYEWPQKAGSKTKK